jgi:hypothetical protein
MDKLKIVNLTPHALNIYDSAGDLVEIVEPSGVVARASTYRSLEGKRGAIELYCTSYANPAVVGTPEPGEAYVVSSIYLQCLRAHGGDDTGIYVPGEAVRDEAGRVIGCVGLSR